MKKSQHLQQLTIVLYVWATLTVLPFLSGCLTPRRPNVPVLDESRHLSKNRHIKARIPWPESEKVSEFLFYYMNLQDEVNYK